MSGVTKKLMGTTAAGGGFTAIEDVFSTYLYTGNGSTQTITNGIDLAGEGGLVWFKRRDTTGNNRVYDTERGMTAATGGAPYLYTNDTAANLGTGFAGSVVATSTGFDITQGAIGDISDSGGTYASWTFRKAPRFFDVVTYTGNGSNSGPTVSHSLGVEPAVIILKETSGTSNWFFYTDIIDGTLDFLLLNTTDAAFNGASQLSKNDSTFTINIDSANINQNGAQYVAYLFAHDPLGPSGDGSDGLIACGSYTGTGAAGLEVDLGWEPQWVMIKKTNAGGTPWHLFDNMRGMDHAERVQIYPNTSEAEFRTTAQAGCIATATGFTFGSSNSGYNSNLDTFIYIAIRRGPMRAPESGTEVFDVDLDGTSLSNGVAFNSGWPVDLALLKGRSDSSNGWFAHSRLQGVGNYLQPNDTLAEAGGVSNATFDHMDGWFKATLAGFSSWMFRRAPEFFDVVAYTGDGVAGRTVSHNLGVAPELMIVKNRTSDGGWLTYAEPRGISKYLFLDQTSAEIDVSVGYDFFFSTSPTATDFTVNSGFGVNASGQTYIAYLFSTLAGVSKVGSYTGNGTSQTIDCGFTTGARFILIKRTDSTGDWYVWDTARGIVAANDPHLSLNTTAAEVTTDDSIDPDSSGFIVNQVAATNINVSAASYIFYAVS